MSGVEQSDRARPDIRKLLGLDQSHVEHWYQNRRSQLIAGGVTIVLLGLYLLWGVGGSSGGLRYVSEPATRGNLVVVVTATGTVEPTNKVDISSELSGTIRNVLVDYNSKVAVGQSLAELDTDKLEASVESARAKLTAAKARVKDAEATVNEKKLDYQRQRQLSARQITSEHNLEIAQAAYERAIASLESARADVIAAAAELKLNETNLSKTCICSPINGIVLSRAASIRDRPWRPISRRPSCSPSPRTWRRWKSRSMSMKQTSARSGKVNAPHSRSTPIRTRQFTARIRELRYGSQVVQGVVTYKAVLATDNAELLLRPGMTATAEITVKNIADALTVPNEALRFAPPMPTNRQTSAAFFRKLIPGRPTLRAPSKHVRAGLERKIWVLGDDRPHEVAVTIGPTDGARTQIVKGRCQTRPEGHRRYRGIKKLRGTFWRNRHPVRPCLSV